MGRLKMGYTAGGITLCINSAHPAGGLCYPVASTGKGLLAIQLVR
jgi:hypothetical protein